MISVVIPAYNEEKYIGKCLQSLMEQEVMPDEIIVVNNNSTDRTEEIVKKFPVILLTEKKKGIIPARRRGFDAAKGTIIARTDADTIVPPDWIKKIKERFEKDRKLVALSGPANFYPLPEVVQMYNWQTVGMNQSFKQVVGHDCMFGFNMSIRKSAWEKVRDNVCRDDKEVHEDIDLSIHIAQFGKIKFDNNLVVKSSSRRLKKLDSYVEYPYRGLKSIAKHSKMVLKERLKERKQVVQRFVESIKFHNLF